MSLETITPIASAGENINVREDIIRLSLEYYKGKRTPVEILEGKKCAREALRTTLKEREQHRDELMEKHPELVLFYSKLTIGRIAEVVADYYGVAVSIAFSHRRHRPLPLIRQITYYLCRELAIGRDGFVKSYPEIGRKLGGRDHATIIHGIQKIHKLLEEDVNLRADIEELRFRLSPPANDPNQMKLPLSEHS